MIYLPYLPENTEGTGILEEKDHGCLSISVSCIGYAGNKNSRQGDEL
jgi:hypothetical protein